MATRYVTLKDANEDTIYPQVSEDCIPTASVSTNKIADSAVTSAKIANGAVTSAKIDQSVLEFLPGQTWDYTWDNNYWVGRQRVVGDAKTISTTIVLPKNLSSSISAITFTPSGYNEAFGSNGSIYSINNPTSSQLTFTCSKTTKDLRTMNIDIAVKTTATLSHNSVCCVDLSGVFTFS